PFPNATASLHTKSFLHVFSSYSAFRGIRKRQLLALGPNKVEHCISLERDFELSACAPGNTARFGGFACGRVMPFDRELPLRLGQVHRSITTAGQIDEVLGTWTRQAIFR